MKNLDDIDGTMLEQKITFTDSETFGARFRRLRRARGLTMEQIGQQLEVSKPSIWAWENGKSRPKWSRISEIARILGVDSHELLDLYEPANAHEIIEQSREVIANAFGVYSEKVKIVIEF